MLTNINDTSKFVINLNRESYKTRKISVGGVLSIQQYCELQTWQYNNYADNLHN